MSMNAEFCLARAEEAGEEADRACLDNVRQRALRSQAAWQAMAHRAAGMAKARAVREQEALKAREQVEDAGASGQDEPA